MKQWIVFAALLLSTPFSVAQNPPSQRELNGILLGQRRAVMVAEFGKPFSSVPHKDDGGVQEVYAVSADQQTYMACEYATKGNGAPLLLQLTGNTNPKTLPFLGLRLGDSKDKVIQALGKPSSVKSEVEFPVELWEYNDRNYSVEIDRSGRLYSIRIVADYGFPESPSSSIPDFESFRKALLSGKIDHLLEAVSADLEIYRHSDSHNFIAGARKELSDPKTAIAKALVDLKTILSDQNVQGDPQLRISEHQPPQSVFKFSPPTALKEIAFRWEAGAWRAYEIAFEN
jgi:hypothetical protein